MNYKDVLRNNVGETGSGRAAPCAGRDRDSDRPVSEIRPTPGLSPTTAPGENPYAEGRSVVGLGATQAKPGSTDSAAKIGANKITDMISTQIGTERTRRIGWLRSEVPDDWLTVSEVAARWRVSRRTILRYIERGQLPASRLPAATFAFGLRMPMPRSMSGDPITPPLCRSSL